MTANITVGSDPFGVAVDASAGTVYVADNGSNDMSVIDAATNEVTATVNVGSSPVGVAADSTAGIVYVANSGSNNLSLIDEATNKVAATVPVGGTPFGVAVDPSAGTVYATNFGSDNVSVIAVATDTVTATVPVGSRPLAVAADTSASTAYVANEASDTVSVISEVLSLSFPAPPSGHIRVAYSDTLSASGGVAPYAWSVSAGALPDGMTLGASSGVLGGTPTAAGTFSFTVKVTDADNKTATEAVSLVIAAGGFGVTATIPVGSDPTEVAVDPALGTVYVTNFADDTVSVIDAATNTVTATIPVGSEPWGVAVDPALGAVYVANYADDTVSVIDVATNTVTATVPVGSAPLGVAVDPALGAVYVANEYSATVSVISAATNTVTATVPVGSAHSQPLGVAVDSSAGAIYVTNFADDTVSVIDAATNTVTATIPVGREPWGVAVNPALGVVYVASEEDDTVSVISEITNTVKATVSVGDTPHDVAVDPSIGAVYVTNVGDGTVSVIDAATNTVKATVSVYENAQPYAVAVDPSTGTAYVTGSSSVWVISSNIPVSLSFPAPPSGKLGVAYSDTLSASGGVTPYAWSVSAGALPAGMTLGASSGVLGGTPTVAGTFSFTVQVTDADNETATEAVSLVIARIAPSVVVTASAASVTFGTSVTLTATVAPSAATGTVVFDDKPSSGPQSGKTVTLGTETLSGGTAALTADLPAFNTNSVTAIYSGDATYAGATSAAAGVRLTAYSGEVLISEFRLSGPSGAADQYAELYNAGPAVSLAGFVLAPSSGTSITVPASAPVLPTGGTYLIAGSAYSLSAVAAPDVTVSPGKGNLSGSIGSAGLKVTAPDGLSTVTDAAGSTGANAGYFSAPALPALSGTPTDQYAWVRVEARGVPVNTGHNATDFQLVSTTGGLVGGVPSALGSPSPRASGSPGQANGVLQSTLLDPSKAATAAPNFAYVPGVAGAPGLLTVRRTITNSSGSTITKALVRITSLSEVHGAPEPGVTTQPSAPAQLRVINPLTTTSLFTVGGTAVTVYNLSVDSPASYNPASPGTGGGGLNTTLTIPLTDLPGGILASGASVSVAFSFAVDGHGSYWFGYDVDALTAVGPLTARGQPARLGTTTSSGRPAALGFPAAGQPARYASGHGNLP